MTNNTDLSRRGIYEICYIGVKHAKNILIAISELEQFLKKEDYNIDSEMIDLAKIIITNVQIHMILQYPYTEIKAYPDICKKEATDILKKTNYLPEHF